MFFSLLAAAPKVLPFTDIIPTATVGWTLVILGVRPWLRARRGLPPRGPRPAAPIEDLRSYEPLEEWMRPGSKPWED